MELLEPLIDEAFVRSTALRIRSPTLQRLTIQVGNKYPAQREVHLLEAKQWENRYRLAWHVAFAAQGDDSKVWESTQADKDEKLKEIASLCGVPFVPPQEWNEFRKWRYVLFKRLDLVLFKIHWSSVP